jgi:hypothetical protein
LLATIHLSCTQFRARAITFSAGPTTSATIARSILRRHNASSLNAAAFWASRNRKFSSKEWACGHSVDQESAFAPIDCAMAASLFTTMGTAAQASRFPGDAPKEFRDSRLRLGSARVSRVRQSDGLVRWRAGDGVLAIANFLGFDIPLISVQKIVAAGRRNQHARSEPDWHCVRYPSQSRDVQPPR